jgi:hypothetical protein
MITKIGSTKIKPIRLKKGDSISILYFGKESKGETIKLNHVLKEEDEGVVDIVGVFKFTNFLDCTSGLAGYFGRSKDGS